jgi:uroporphyrinogen-III decarboxylase
MAQYVHLYHPDLQGPIDICELLWGSSIFYAFIDTPDMVKALLELVTETYIQFMRAWNALEPYNGQWNMHGGALQRGRIMLRDDSAMNLSPAMFTEFIEPYDRRLLAEFGGGSIHFCGRGDHYIQAMSNIPNLYAINLTQPELNDMEVIYQHTVDKGICLLGLERKAAETALAAGRNLHGKIHTL